MYQRFAPQIYGIWLLSQVLWVGLHSTGGSNLDGLLFLPHFFQGSALGDLFRLPWPTEFYWRPPHSEVVAVGEWTRRCCLNGLVKYGDKCLSKLMRRYVMVVVTVFFSRKYMASVTVGNVESRKVFCINVLIWLLVYCYYKEGKWHIAQEVY